MTETDYKNLLALINRVPNINGAEVEAVAALKAKVLAAMQTCITPPPTDPVVNSGAPVGATV